MPTIHAGGEMSFGDRIAMKSPLVYVIHNSDGDTTVEQMTPEELESRLDEHYYGDAPQFLDRIPQSDTNYWPEHAILVITGEISVPQAEQVVTRWRLSSTAHT